MEKLLRVEDICELLQVKRSTVYEWTHTDYIPHYKLPKGVRFKSTEIMGWLKRRKVKGRATYKIEIF